MSSERFIEATGSSVEEAIAKGLEQLGVGPNDVIVEVLEEASRGMFGLTSRPARVRLQLLVQRAAPPSPPPPAPAPTPAAPVKRVVVDADDADDDDDFADEGLTDEDAEVARVVLGEILEKLSIRASVSVRRAESGEDEDEAPWLLNVTGSGDLSVLIGKRGETLASLQYLTRLITSREIQRRANIVVDVDSYKARRTSKLQELALRMAEQAVREQRTISLEPMPPYERRIIHMVLRDRTDVSTESVGEGTARKITIVPTK